MPALALRSLPVRADTPLAGTHALSTTAGNRLMLPIEINGKAVEALLDSAAEATLIDRRFAASAGLARGEAVAARGSGAAEVDAEFVHGVTIDAIGLRLQDRTVAVLDLADVGTRLLGHPLHVILGRDLFDAARLTIDIAGRTIGLADPEVTPPGVGLPLTTQHGIETFPARVEGGSPVHAAFDLGNGSNVLLGADYVQRADLLAHGRKIEHERGGGLGGEVERQVIVLDSIEIAGETFRDVPASIEDNASATDLNIGISILKHFLITTDFPQHRLWLARRDRDTD
jgi:predicted aspartyl protease